MRHVPFTNGVILCALILFGSMVLRLPTGVAQEGAAPPVLGSATATSPLPGEIAVSGGGFTPGGLVYVVLYDRWGTAIRAHSWAVATAPAWGANGSQDPAQGYVAGGSMSGQFTLQTEAIHGPNGSQDPAQGYVAALEQGSGSVTFSGTALMGPPVYGANGSQDPAQGYSSGDLATDGGAACGRDLMVRAYDVRAHSWSNVLDVTAGC